LLSIKSESEDLGFATRGVSKAAWKWHVFRWHRKELTVLDERIESGREFQTADVLSTEFNNLPVPHDAESALQLYSPVIYAL